MYKHTADSEPCFVRPQKYFTMALLLPPCLCLWVEEKINQQLIFVLSLNFLFTTGSRLQVKNGFLLGPRGMMCFLKSSQAALQQKASQTGGSEGSQECEAPSPSISVFIPPHTPLRAPPPT